MRHFGSLLLAAVFAPAVFLLTGTGLSAFASARSDTFTDDPFGTLAALGALLLAGVLYGILVMVRLSPVGPGLAGIALMGASVFALVAPATYDETLSSLQVHMGGAVGQWGLGVLLGVPLLATLTSPRRWRRSAEPAETGQPGPQPSTPDETRQMPKQPEYLTLPDIAAPSLRYPGVAPGAPPPPPQTPATPASTKPATSGPTGRPGAPPPPRLPNVAPASSKPAEPLPRRVPSPPPGQEATVKISPDEDPTKPLSPGPLS